MKNLLILFLMLTFGGKLISQEHLNIPTKFPTDYGTFTFPLRSKITIELKEKDPSVIIHLVTVGSADAEPIIEKKIAAVKAILDLIIN